MRASHITWALLLLTVLVGRSQASTEFLPLGDLPGGRFFSVAQAVSADGSVVVGSSIVAESGGPAPGGERREAFRWTQATGMVGLGFLPNDVASVALGVSADGSVVVGQSVGQDGGGEAFRWTQATGMVALGVLTADSFRSAALGVSGDGSVVVGVNQSPSRRLEAFRWTSSTGMVSLGDLPDGDFASIADAISMDGSVIVGQGESASGPEAFRWTEAGGMVGLGKIPGRPLVSFASEAFAVSADGSVVVGTDCSNPCPVTSGNEAFQWTAAEGMIGLGVLPGGVSSGALAVSPGGSVVVGESNVLEVQEAFLWDRDHGIRSLREILIAQGDDLAGWQLASATGISADGRIIAGAGINPAGTTEAWLARVDGSGVINNLVTLTPIESTFNTSTSTSGCPTGFVGRFSFTARLTDASSLALSNLMAKVTVLTDGNLLQNADGAPAGVGATLTIPRLGDFSDGVLSPGESVEVPLSICLTSFTPFRLFVDVQMSD